MKSIRYFIILRALMISRVKTAVVIIYLRHINTFSLILLDELRVYDGIALKPPQLLISSRYLPHKFKLLMVVVNTNSNKSTSYTIMFPNP